MGTEFALARHQVRSQLAGGVRQRELTFSGPVVHSIRIKCTLRKVIAMKKLNPTNALKSNRPQDGSGDVAATSLDKVFKRIQTVLAESAHSLPIDLQNKIWVSDARSTLTNVVLRAQDSVQVIENGRTHRRALMMGEEVLRDLLARQAIAAFEEIAKEQPIFEEESATRHANESRLNFLVSREQMEPVDTEVPIEPGMRSIEDVAIG